MTAFIVLFGALFLSILLWRTVFVRQKDRQAIRFGFKELALAAAIAALVVGLLFFLMFNTTLRLV